MQIHIYKTYSQCTKCVIISTKKKKKPTVENQGFFFLFFFPFSFWHYCISRVRNSKGSFFFFFFFNGFCFLFQFFFPNNLTFFFSNKLVFNFFNIFNIKIIYLLINTVKISRDTRAQHNMHDSCTVNIDTFTKTPIFMTESIQCM